TRWANPFREKRPFRKGPAIAASSPPRHLLPAAAKKPAPVASPLLFRLLLLALGAHGFIPHTKRSGYKCSAAAVRAWRPNSAGAGLGFKPVLRRRRAAVRPMALSWWSKSGTRMIRAMLLRRNTNKPERR